MKIAIVTFEGFNEIDSFVALNILNRVNDKDWTAEIVAPEDHVTSMNGVVVRSQQPFPFINQADAVLFGSGRLTRTVVKDKQLMASMQLNPLRQLIGSQCSGALVMKHLGLVNAMPVCTDSTTAPWLVEAGAEVINRPFFAKGNDRLCYPTRIAAELRSNRLRSIAGAIAQPTSTPYCPCKCSHQCRAASAIF